MRSIIEELYFGNIKPSERDVIKDGEYANIVQLLARNESELTETLTPEQKEIFEKFKDCTVEMDTKNEILSFALGFKLGMWLTIEAMADIDDITEPRI